ncbi:MAG: tRNA pseudouridine(13) synthase TruD [Gemmataceae bacterium]|nr:tRNA pseudouridine(13) synthase TruD [Gemmataceae bacterium]
MTPTPLLTADLPGTGGRLKAELDDFEVEEIPAYEPSGDGPHLYLWIEKRDLGGEFFLRQVAQRLGIRPGDVGTAGIKDRRAVTRQWVSVPAETEPRLGSLDGDGIRMLKTTRHGNKLKPGHLRGNRFRILIRDVGTDGLARCESILGRIRTHGLPNYYGSQRFGRNGETATLGFRQLREGPDRRLSPFLRKLSLSAAQSDLFNDYLSRRLTDGLLRTVMVGDVLGKWPAGGMFTCMDATVDQPRFDAREVVSTGPMFGRKMFPAGGIPAEREAALLRDRQLTPDSFRGFGQLLDGTRRHNLVYINDLEVASEDTGLRLSFSLPSGCYATVLLREVMKWDAEPDEA